MFSLRCLMKNLKPLLFLTAILHLPSCSMAEMPEADSAYLPLSIDQVETDRVEGHWLRHIKHNMELKPSFELELIDPAGPTGVDGREVTSVLLNGKTLRLAESAGVRFESR